MLRYFYFCRRKSNGQINLFFFSVFEKGGVEQEKNAIR